MAYLLYCLAQTALLGGKVAAQATIYPGILERRKPLANAYDPNLGASLFERLQTGSIPV